MSPHALALFALVHNDEEVPMALFYAHSSSAGNPPPEGWQLLADHLCGVARLARKLADETGMEKFGLSEAAYAAGLLHDLGKYQQEFQSYLQASAKKERHSRVPHAPLGAASAFALTGLANGLAIAGHHQGLPDMAALRRYGKEWDAKTNQIWESAIEDCPELNRLQRLQFPEELAKDPLCSDVFIRMLFSCLVDADWCDTNAWKEGCYPYEYRPLALEASSRFVALDEHVRAKSIAGEVNAIRREVHANCVRAGRHPQGFFTLTVPTGGGKTLASLAFALTHCNLHQNNGGARRIIYVIPYLNILEQTANVFYEALGIPADGRVVFEHHSLAYVGRAESNGGSKAVDSAAETEMESPVARRMEENWKHLSF